MARTTLPPQSDETPIQVQTQTQAPPWTSSIPIIALVVRLITLGCLIISTSLLASNSTTIRGYYNTTATVHFSDIYAYRYALAAAVIGLVHNLLQLPFSIHQVMSSGKRLPSHARLVFSEFLGDKVVLGLLGTGVGAAFGATVDLKKSMDDLEDAVELYLNMTTFSPFRSKLDDFFNRAYFPAIFLLIAFFTSLISSVLSSLALMKTTQQ